MLYSILLFDLRDMALQLKNCVCENCFTVAFMTVLCFSYKCLHLGDFCVQALIMNKIQGFDIMRSSRS
jgi:hypothetical protein